MYRLPIPFLVLPLILLLSPVDVVGQSGSDSDEETDWGTRTGFQLSTDEDIADWSREIGQYVAANALNLAGEGDNEEVGVELFERFFVSADGVAWMVENSVPEIDREADARIDEEELLDVADDAIDDLMLMMAGVGEAGYDLGTVRYETFAYTPTDPDDWASYEVALLFSCRNATSRVFFSAYVECCEVRGALKLYGVEDYDVPEPD